MKDTFQVIFLILVFSCFTITGLRGQNVTDQIEKLGVTEVEYNEMLKHADVPPLSPKTSQLTLTLNKVYGNSNDTSLKHIFIQSNREVKNNPNRPNWSLIPYVVIREEGCDENQ